MIRVTFATEDQTAERHQDLYDSHDYLVHAVEVASSIHRSRPDAPGMWFAEWLAELKNALGPELCACEWYAASIAEMDELVRAPRLGEVGKKVFVWVNCCGVIRGNFPGRDTLGRTVFRLKRGGGGDALGDGTDGRDVSMAEAGGDALMEGDLDIDEV